MDYGVPDENEVAYNGDEDYEGHHHLQRRQFDEEHNDGNDEQEYYGGDVERFDRHVDDSAGHELKHSMDDSSAGKLFVGGIAWETSEESFSRYFGKYGELTDSVIMLDKNSGRPRGFGFVTFADPEVANKVLQEEHIIDGRTVEVKRTVPREDMQVKGVSRTRKIFVGGIPVTLAEDELKEYFSSYGNIVEHQIMLDHKTGRSRGFGFVTFENEDAVDRILSDGRMHELGGKQVEIKRAEPKRAGFDFGSENRSHRGGSKSYGNYNGGGEGFDGGYGGKMGKAFGGYGGFGGNYGGYGNYVANYGANAAAAAAGFYAGYGGYGYGYGFGGPMYGAAGYGGSGFGAAGGYAGAAGGFAGGKGFPGGGGGSNWYDGAAKGFGVGGSATGYGGGKGYGSGGSASGHGGGKGYGNGGAAGGRFHPYRK